MDAQQIRALFEERGIRKVKVGGFDVDGLLLNARVFVPLPTSGSVRNLTGAARVRRTVLRLLTAGGWKR